MKIQAEEKNDVVVLRLSGHMDLGNIALLTERVQEYRGRGRKKFVFNMIDVNNLSSTGIARVFQVHRDLEIDGGRLVLTELSAVVEYVLDLARLADEFTVVEHEAQAIEALK